MGSKQQQHYHGQSNLLGPLQLWLVLSSASKRTEATERTFCELRAPSQPVVDTLVLPLDILTDKLGLPLLLLLIVL